MSLYEKFQHNIDSLIDPKELQVKQTIIAVAVSGGADSVALLSLMSKWAKKNDGKIVVMTVNHNLRQEAKLECDYVKVLCESLGHLCIQLDWDSGNNLSNLQARAREGRYRLMTDACRELGILTLLTAHHQDDYIENFCIRGKRKSGDFGLSSNNINFYDNIRILRPLFNIPKQELINYLVENKIKWLEDESNLSDKYQRNRIRKIIAKQGEGFREEIILQQAMVNERVEELQSQLIVAIAESAKIYDFGFAVINLQSCNKFTKEIMLHLISHIVTVISGNTKIPRFESVDKILGLLEQNVDFIKTLHGCVLKRIGTKLLIYREFGRRLPEKIMLSKAVMWDNRFYFKGNADILHNAYISNLSMKDYVDIKDNLDLQTIKDLSFNNHKKILFTLPVIKILEKIVALPHISYYNTQNLVGKLDFMFQPSFTSRFTHFF